MSAAMKKLVLVLLIAVLPVQTLAAIVARSASRASLRQQAPWLITLILTATITTPMHRPGTITRSPGRQTLPDWKPKPTLPAA